jgi:heme O synthase-like polyprenyltransferase
VLGLGLIALSCLDLRGRNWSRRLFAYSSFYLALVFALLAVGAVV